MLSQFDQRVLEMLRQRPLLRVGAKLLREPDLVQ